jgi:hypothetical protein
VKKPTFFFFEVLLHIEGGPDAGKQMLAHVRITSRDEVEARRSIIGYVASQSKPMIPPNSSAKETEHIEENWCRMRVRSLTPEPETDLAEVFRIPPTVPMYWWGWDELPAPGAG